MTVNLEFFGFIIYTRSMRENALKSVTCDYVRISHLFYFKRLSLINKKYL